MTINSSYCERDVLFNDKKYKFSFWDTAGQEKFNSITPIYYRDAKGVLLVYDISNPHSFERVKKWIEEMKEINNEAVFNIVGNKYDLKEQTKNFKFNFIDDEIAKKLAQKNKTDLFFTSAKTGENINQCFEDGNDVPIRCNDFNCSDPNDSQDNQVGLTELDSDGKWLGHLRCSRKYIDINDIDANVDERNNISQYRYDFKFNFLSEPDKKSTKTGTVQSQFLQPFEDSRNYDDLLAYYYSQCINGYYEKSCNYLFNYCVIAMYNEKNDICTMIKNLASNLGINE
jgi:small GTP-binding protein